MFVVKVPLINGLGRTNGCEESGNLILKHLKEIFSNEEGKKIDVKGFELEEIHVDKKNLEEANNLIYKNSLEMFETKEKTIFLGGDHSISFSICRAFLDYCKNNNKAPFLIVFDAHADCMNPVDKKIPTHEDWLFSLINSGFPVENILLVGIRNIYESELEFIKKNKIKVIEMPKLFDNLDDMCDLIMELSNKKETYISIDIDVIDPAFAPGVAYKEAGGLSSREIIYMIQRLKKIKTLKAIDLVEINPKKDKEELTLKIGAKIVSEFI
jgi:agmatinase